VHPFAHPQRLLSQLVQHAADFAVLAGFRVGGPELREDLCRVRLFSG